MAVKCLKAEMYDKYHKDFEKEYKIMVKLKHERIVEILGMCPQRDAGENKSTAYSATDQNC